MIIIVCVCGLGLGVGCWVWMGYRMYHTIPVGCVWVMYDTVIKFWGLYLVFCVLFCIVLHCRWGRGLLLCGCKGRGGSRDGRKRMGAGGGLRHCALLDMDG